MNVGLLYWGLCRSLKALKIGAARSKPGKSKQKLMDLLKCESDDSGESDGAVAGCSKSVKKAMYSDTILEDVPSALRHSSISVEAFEPPEVEETLSKVKKKKKKRK